ncbi:DUF2848 domain-containing protein [Corticimicrobacter populi]|uniref:DUF2848 domain-containing protein n=1 Tax=Corticimicrobacter populi TaxID=2175229 RepID=A0A2V1JTW1_9BURK|nr:DUF2848 domain-containing protein [Corticimicrobacter populi]PWF21431.1 DUF2848 domain-containing protein [Corticimicrobacter populi]
MLLTFSLHHAGASRAADIDIRQCIIAGWAGRDLAAIEHHIEELAELGVPRPSAVPLFYRVAANQLTQDEVVQCVGPASSGEAEVFLFEHDGDMWVSLGSDHTDRALEAHSVALSKQLCAKPVARDAWRYEDVATHWDQLVLRAWIVENGVETLYQEGTLASLQPPEFLLQKHFGLNRIPAGSGMTCGTVGAIGGIRPAPSFRMELHDPLLDRRIGHGYTIDFLPEVA